MPSTPQLTPLFPAITPLIDTATNALGLPGARTWRDEWAEFLSPYELIYVVGDADQAGRAMTEKVVQQALQDRREFAFVHRLAREDGKMRE